MKQRKKILFFLPGTVGGAERMTVAIGKMLPRDEFEVKFVVVGRSLGDIVKFIPEGYETSLLRIRALWDFCTIRIAHHIRKEKPYAVFASLIYLNARVIWAGKFMGVKVVVRNNMDFFNVLPKSRWYAKTSYRWADYIIAQQEEMRESIITTTHSKPQNVITLQNPIDTDLIDEKVKALSPYKNDDTTIKYVWTARIHKSKGQDTLVKAFHMVHSKNPNTKLYLVGKYDESDAFYWKLKQYIEANELSESVLLTGFDDNPYKWVANAGCYVMPSRKEGLPNSLIDAMYLERPVVATTCIPVVSRIVQDGYNGILVAPEDIQSMAEAMLKALTLHDFKMTYTGADKDAFIKLFR